MALEMKNAIFLLLFFLLFEKLRVTPFDKINYVVKVCENSEFLYISDIYFVLEQQYSLNYSKSLNDTYMSCRL